jgi:alkanesulfonate monooxygenase SsuD/methylene tetrahydromethanopterin reductase-like flavin-dependent oxidoreductase (luciferase family)
MTLAPLRHSKLIAQEAQLVSRLVQGQFHLGLGRGFLPGDVQEFGLNHTEATAKFWATVEELAALRSDQQWVQNIWVATTSSDGAKTAGRLGLGLALNPYTRTEVEIDTSISIYRDYITRSGLSHLYRVLIHEPLYLDETITVATKIASSNFAHYLSALKSAEGSTGTKATETHHTLGDHDYASRCAFLDESAFSERLIKWQKRGATHWCFLVRFGNLTDSSVGETIMRCARSAASVPRL